MSVYLDASILVPLFVREDCSRRALAFIRSEPGVVLVSDFASAEFASALARRVRMGELVAESARAAFAIFDAWLSRVPMRVEIAASDVATAAAFIRRLELALRTPDALHIAVAQRADASLATFDDKMAAAAMTLGLRTEQI